MFEVENILSMLMGDAKKLFFSAEWLDMDLKLSKTEIFSLLFLGRNKQATMTELAEYINSPTSTATGIADRLVKKGYISRERSERDRRIVMIALTEKGEEFVRDFKGLLAKYAKVVFRSLTREEKQFLLNIAHKIINNLQDEIMGGTVTEKGGPSLKKIHIE